VHHSGKKLHYLVAHVEAGLRSGDRQMPEEIPRLVTDSITAYFFVTEASGSIHLGKEGHPDRRIFFVGHVMIDNLFYELERLDATPNLSPGVELAASLGEYGVVTLHRPSNVDTKETLHEIVSALNETRYLLN